MELLTHPHLYNKTCDQFVLRSIPAVLTPAYRDVVRAALTDGSYAELVHLFAASKAFDVQLQSYCCPYNASDIHPYTMLVNRAACLQCMTYTSVTVMWTTTSTTQQEPNHFVLLVPREHLNATNGDADEQPATGADTSMDAECTGTDTLSAAQAAASVSLNDESMAPSVEEPTVDSTQACQMSALDLTDGDPNCSAATADFSTLSQPSRVTFELLDKASNKGRRLLVDSRGFSYCVKTTRNSAVYWRCSLRTKAVTCKATVVQHGDDMTLGVHEHIHPPTSALKTIRSVRLCCLILDQFITFKWAPSTNE